MIGVALVSAVVGVRRVAAQHVQDGMDRGVTADWVVTAGQLPPLPGVVADHARRRARALRRVGRARRAGARSTATRSSSAPPTRLPSSNSINVGLERRQLGGAAAGRDLRPPGPGQRPRLGGRLDASTLTFQNGVTRRVPGRRHLQRRRPRRQLADVVGRRSTRSCPASRTTSSSPPKTADGVEPGRGEAGDRGGARRLPAGEDRDRRAVQGLAGRRRSTSCS